MDINSCQQQLLFIQKQIVMVYYQHQLLAYTVVANLIFMIVVICNHDHDAEDATV